MAASAARPTLALLASASALLGAGRRARARLSFSSSLAASAALRGRRAFAAAAGGAVIGKTGPGLGAVDADAGMDAVQRRLMFEDECILVDEQDSVIGHESKYNCHLMEKIEAGHVLHRAFSVFLFNSKYELLLQQRSATKVTFPLVWTNTCCSHPLYRESELIEENCVGVRNAAQRKLFDELGIVADELPVDQFIPLGRMLYKAPSDGKWGEHELDYLLFMVRDVKLNPNPEEVADVKYMSRDQLKELLRKADAGEDGVKLSPWFRLVVDNFLMGWWDHVEQGTLQEAADMKTIHKNWIGPGSISLVAELEFATMYDDQKTSLGRIHDIGQFSFTQENLGSCPKNSATWKTRKEKEKSTSSSCHYCISSVA